MGFGFARVRIKGIRISEGLLYLHMTGSSTSFNAKSLLTSITILILYDKYVFLE